MESPGLLSRLQVLLAQLPRTRRLNVALDRRHWHRLKDRHKGRRGFVIGNGPSLRVSDLSRLAGEVTIASNKVYMAYPETSWRPDYLTIVDPLVWAKVQEDLPGKVPEVFIASYLNRRMSSVPCVQWRTLGLAKKGRDPVQFSSDLAKGAWGGTTVTYENLQLAVHLGLDPIYVIGCDHFYAGESNVVEGVPIEAGEVSNHFIKNYRKPGEKVNPASIHEMNEAYSVARDFSDHSGIRILNATRGGHLEAFVRADLDSLLP